MRTCVRTLFLEGLTTFSGRKFEALGGPALQLIMRVQHYIVLGGNDNIIESLSALASQIELMELALGRMYENNLPQAFYKRVRPYLSGWTNDPDMPNGLHYGSACTGEKYAGASAAQSPIFHVLDAAIGVLHPAHQPDEVIVGKETRVGMPGAYLKEMRGYMLKNHRECIAYLEERLTIRAYVSKNRHHPELLEAYNSCVSALESFRSSHIRMVSFYIVSQAAKEGRSVQGTGGSNPLPLLKNIRTHVQEAKLE